MASDGEKWRRFELLLANFQAIGRSQSRFVNTLLTFVCLVWAVELLKISGDATIQVLGVTFKVQRFWQLVPLVTGILCLGLIGSINIIHHAWRRLDLYLLEAFSDPAFFFTELDPHKNILDYMGFLTISFKKPILPDVADQASEPKLRWNPQILLYPALVLLSVFTTLFSMGRVGADTWWVVFALVSAVVQTTFALPFLVRKICLFLGVHRNAYDGIEWGDAALHAMPLETLRKLAERRKGTGEGK